MDFTRVFDILPYQQSKYPGKEALNAFVRGRWVSYSIEEIQHRVDIISSWLHQQGYSKGDKIAFVPKMGKPEWMMLDFACQQLGVVVVPIHPTSTKEEYEFILSETGCKSCVVADTALFYKLSLFIEKSFPKLTLYHLKAGEEGYFPGFDVKKISPAEMTEVDKIRGAVKPEDVLTIMYTSGTSGEPKGVVLTHNNVVSCIKSVITLMPITYKDRVISFLPFSHIFERTSTYTYLVFGVSIWFAQNREHLETDIKSVRPTMFTGVPRVLEKMYDLLKEEAYTRNWMKRKVIRWAIKIGKKYKEKKGFIPLYRLKLMIARLLVLNKWKSRLGGKIRYIIIGAAALRPDIARLFSAAGVRVRCGYGMTETSPYISTNRFEPGMNRFDTVGMPVAGIELKINEPDENGEGEIWVKGPNVMQGYYHRPQLTKEVMSEDGWLKTGDVGKMVETRFLKITGRKKDIFKTSAGKYIAPEPLQSYFKQSLFIEHCLIIGFQQPFVTGIIVPNFSVLEKWCKKEKIHWTAPQFMVHNIRVREKFEEEVNRLNVQLPNFKTMRDFFLCHEDWSIETGEYSASYKLIRHKLLDKHSKEIEKMYK
ncbi:MAG: long-chain fatty acid--CoA ligase [Bacteroidetes bacterium]|nr:MAG: long-chain fatty acid--CoA ligase [Bacteroidota bacterium]